jgi:hypothetical protein
MHRIDLFTFLPQRPAAKRLRTFGQKLVEKQKFVLARCHVARYKRGVHQVNCAARRQISGEVAVGRAERDSRHPA